MQASLQDAQLAEMGLELLDDNSYKCCIAKQQLVELSRLYDNTSAKNPTAVAVPVK